MFFFLVSSGSISNIHKVYKEQDSVVEALRGEPEPLPVALCVLRLVLMDFFLTLPLQV